MLGVRVDRYKLKNMLGTSRRSVGHPCLATSCATCAITSKWPSEIEAWKFPHERLEASKSTATRNRVPPCIVRRTLRPLEDQSRRNKGAHRGIVHSGHLRYGETISEKALQLYGNELSHFLSKCLISLDRSNPAPDRSSVPFVQRREEAARSNNVARAEDLISRTLAHGRVDRRCS